MATIRKRGTAWHVQIRRAGYPPLSRSFQSKADATVWARDREGAIDRSELPATTRELKSVTVGDLLTRYGETVTPTKRGAGPEQYRLRVLRAHPLSKLSLVKLSPA